MAASDLPKQRKPRGEGKRFAPGTSGNPTGRKPGTRTRSTVFGEAILQRDADAILEAVVAAAKGGDSTAMRLCIERLIPVRKGRPIGLSLPPVKTIADIDAALSVIIAAMAKAELSAEEASAFAAVVEQKRKAIELGEHARRLDAIEERLKLRENGFGQHDGATPARVGGEGGRGRSARQ